jgi:hypothetical protein
VKATNILLLAYGIDGKKSNTTVTNDRGENIAAEAHILQPQICVCIAANLTSQP